jgi:hypothetical protein
MTRTPEEVFQQQPHLWTRLDRLRKIFLNREKDSKGAEVYWDDVQDLWAYDMSFARRIANKWESVLCRIPENILREWSLLEWVDWGCGSAVASEILARFAGNPPQIWLWDHSPRARAYSQKKLLDLGVAQVQEMKEPLANFSGKVLLMSHLVNELREEVLSALLASLKDAAAVVWVEAGSRETSQKLSRCRDRLLASNKAFDVLLPCPHRNAKCPLSREDATDWCHFFADVDPHFHQNPFWREFADRMGVDLRSLPLSTLVLHQKVPGPREQVTGTCEWGPGTFRVLGTPRVYKGYLKVQACHGREGVREYILEKRSDKSLFKRLKDPPALSLYEWQLSPDQSKILSGHELSGQEVGRKQNDDDDLQKDDLQQNDEME